MTWTRHQVQYQTLMSCHYRCSATMIATSRRLHYTEAPNPAPSSHESCSVTRLGLSYTSQLELGTEGSELPSFWQIFPLATPLATPMVTCGRAGTPAN